MRKPLHIYFDRTKQPYLITPLNYPQEIAWGFGIFVETFQKVSMIQEVSKKGLKMLANGIKVLSKAEGMEGHYRTIACRLNKRRKK